MKRSYDHLPSAAASSESTDATECTRKDLPLHAWQLLRDTFQCTALFPGTSYETVAVAQINFLRSLYPQMKMVKLYRPNQR